MSVVGSLEPPTYSIACIPADGIGIEVIEAGVEVLKTLAEVSGTFKLEFEDYDWSSETYKKTGKYIPDGGLESLKKHNAILFGAVGAPGMSNQSSKESPQKLDASTITHLSTVSPARHDPDRKNAHADFICRRPGPHITMGTATCNLPDVPTIRQRPADQSLSRHRIATTAMWKWRSRLGDYSREQ